jgi:hypothetical protein
MFQSGAAYLHLKGVLDEHDINYLKNGCKEVLETERIPCFSLIDRLESKTVTKIRAALEEKIGEELFYLNDFYIYTDSSFKTAWHMDTELFSFDRAVNAWILLSPEEVSDPLGFIDGLNASPENYFHSVTSEEGNFVFSEYHKGRRMTCSVSEIEARQIHTPVVHMGDILAIDPGRFHKTNVSSPKHAISVKFLLKGEDGFLSKKQVRSVLWPEVKTFNKLVKGTTDWSQVIDGIRSALRTDEGRKTLSSGFYPAQFGVYLERVRSI